MFKRYRKVVLAVVAVGYAVAAIIFPDVLLPDQESVVSIIDAIAEAFGETE